jgi:hypothetical protein
MALKSRNFWRSEEMFFCNWFLTAKTANGDERPEKGTFKEELSNS